MIELLSSGFSNQLTGLFKRAHTEVIISSPFVSQVGIEVLLNALRAEFVQTGSLHFITNLSPQNILQGSTDPSALLLLVSCHPTVRLWHLPRLHAKVYIVDQCNAIITSSNLTAGGLYRNYEYGIRITDQSAVERVRTDVLDYGALGASLDHQALSTYCTVAEDLRNASRKSQDRLQSDFKKRIRDAEDELIKQRLAHGPMTTVFERTILYLLQSQGALSTPEIHSRIAEVHPDLCDDSIDRIIDGRHFGKKWKHAVRTAQSHLKERGQIRLSDRKWRLNVPQ